MKNLARLASLVLFTAIATNVYATDEKPKAAMTTGVTKLETIVTAKGFEPASFEVPAGTPVELTITRKVDETETCALQVIVPSKKIKQDLPLNKPVTLKLGKLKKGEIKFGCQMSMMIGAVIVAK